MAPWRKTGAPGAPVKKGSAISGATSSAPTGNAPLVIPFASTTMSGRIGQRSMPNQVPSRPKPQITQSAMKSTPWRVQISATASM